MSKLTRTRKPRLLLLAVAVGVVAFACWPRGPRLEWYRSPAYRVNGEAVRVELLVPEGWRPLRNPDELDAYSRTSGSILLRLDAPERVRRMPEWVQKVLGRYGKEGGHVRIQVVAAIPGVKRKTLDVGEFDAVLKLPGPPAAFVRYLNLNIPEFEATYRQICESFRVVK